MRLLKYHINIQFAYGTVSLTVTLAKFFTFSLTTAIPRSSDAFNSKIRDRKRVGPNNSRAKARIVEVLPVPGGP